MEDFGKKREQVTKESAKTEQAREETSYPSTIEKMSEKWRSIRRQGESPDQRGFFERNFLALGVFIALLLIALFIVIGGFAFLVWNAR
jgi:hypothetical protein